MMDTIQIDRAGRLVLPKKVREHLRLEGGDTLAVELKGDAIVLRSTKIGTRLKRVKGVLVVAASGKLLSGRDFVAEERDSRIDDVIRR